MNNYNFTGRLGRDSETRFTQGGMAICSFTVAVDYGFGDNKGTNWVRCSLFGKRAEGKLPQYLVKGTQVAISGELRVREYDDKEGNRRTSVDVSVGSLDLIGSKQDSGASNSNHAPQNGGQPFSPSGENGQQGGFPTHGGGQQHQASDPFANAPNFDVPEDGDIPF